MVPPEGEPGKKWVIFRFLAVHWHIGRCNWKDVPAKQSNFLDV